MSASSSKTEQSSTPAVGTTYAAQPLSGVTLVNSTASVHGVGHGGFVRIERTAKKSNAA